MPLADLADTREAGCNQLWEPRAGVTAPVDPGVPGSTLSGRRLVSPRSASRQQRGQVPEKRLNALTGQTLLPSCTLGPTRAGLVAGRVPPPRTVSVTGGVSPVAGLVTWQSPCTLLLTGQAATVGQAKVYSQLSTTLTSMGREF